MDTTVDRPRRRLATLLAWCLVLLLSWGLWTWQLDAGGLTNDEAASFHLASQPLPQLITNLQEVTFDHPPAYYSLLNLWMGLAGPSEFSLRLLSIAVGVASLALMGWVARQTLPTLAGLSSIVPAVLLAITPGMAHYVRVARMYSLVVALPLLSSGFLLRGFLRKDAWPHWTAIAGLAIANLIAATTHYYLVFTILVQPIPLLLTRRWKPLVAWCGAQVAPALAVLAWFVFSPGPRMTAEGVRPAIVIPTRFQLSHLLGKLLFSPVVRVRFGILYVLLVLVALGVLVAIWRDHTGGLWLLVSLLLPAALAFLLPRFPSPRYILFVLPFAALALGALCTSPFTFAGFRGKAVAAAASAGLAVSVASLLARGGLQQAVATDGSHYGRTLETIEALARPGDVILLYGPWQKTMFDYYDPGGLPPTIALPEHAPPRLRPAEAEPVLRDLTETYARIWVLPAAVSDVDPQFHAGSWLRNNTHDVWETGDFGLYLPALPTDADVEESQLVFGDVLQLESVAHEELPVPAGEALRLTLTWRPLHVIEQHVQMTLSLVDLNGRVWAVTGPIPGYWAAAADTWSPERTVAIRDGLIVPQGAPPGSYSLRLMISDAATGTPLPVNGASETELLTVKVSEPAAMPVYWGLPGLEQTRFCSPDGSACVRLVGYEPGGYRFQQGHPVLYTLHWVAEGPPLPDVAPHLIVTHDPLAPWVRENTIVSATLPSPWAYASESASCGPSAMPTPASGAAEMPEWGYRVMLPLVMADAGCVLPASGRLVTSLADFVLPPDAKEGRALVGVSVLGPDGQMWRTDEGETFASLFEIDIEKRPTLRSLPADLTPVEVDFGEEVTLRGYRVQGNARPGGKLRITYAWYAKGQPTQIFSVFNHLTDSDGTVVAQADGWPLEGRILTIQWQPREYVRDTHIVEIPADAPPGPYTLHMGVYDAATGHRPIVVEAGTVRADGRIQIPLPGEPAQ